MKIQSRRCQVRQSTAFSLVELLVVIAVLAVIATVGIGSFVGIRNSALESTIDSQEQSINSLYRSLKASSTNVPTTQEAILSYLATNSVSTLTPPMSLDSPDGSAILTFDPTADLFAYRVASGDGGDVPLDNEVVVSRWNPGNFVPSNRTGTYNEGVNMFPEAWFDETPRAEAGGPAVYYMPGADGLQFEPFRVSVAADGTSTVTTESGQTYAMDRATKAFIAAQGGYQIHWNDDGGSVKVSSVVQR